MPDATKPVPPDQPANQIGVPADPMPAPAGATAPPPCAQPQGANPVAAPIPPASIKRSNVRAWVVGSLAVVLVLCAGGVGIAALSNDDSERADGAASSAASRTTSTTSTSAAPVPSSASSTAPALSVYDAPTKSDFNLKVKVLRKQCFGSAGCNISYRIDVTYTGIGDLDPSNTYEVTYQVNGAEDPIINTFEVTGDSASVPEEEMASTKRSGDKLTAVVTDVSEL